jgi:FlaA1/EpsC-like NDP-sugar epimerase
MSIFQITLFILFLFLAVSFLFFLTHLHYRILNYVKIAEILVHITRSYLLFMIFTVPVIYSFFTNITLKTYFFVLSALLIMHIFLAIVFLLFRRKRMTGYLNNQCEKSEKEDLQSVHAQNFSLSDDARESVLESLNVIENKRS